MIPESLEYSMLLVVFATLIVALFTPQVIRILQTRQFWLSVAAFIAIWTVFDILGIRARAWIFSPVRLTRVAILGVPIEEYLVFFLIHLCAVAAWNSFQEDPLEMRSTEGK